MRYGLILTALLISSTVVIAAENYNYVQGTPASQYQPTYYQQTNYNPNPTTNYNPNAGVLKGSVITVPAGQQIKTIVTTPLNSGTLTLGQNVSLALGTDFYYNGSLIAPAGSYVNGTVLEVAAAKHGSLNGKLLVRFTQIVTPQGIQIPISAIIKTNDNTGVLVGGTGVDVAKEYTKDVAVGTAAGAVSGVVFGALAGGNIGKGAALGTAVGAGGGLVKSIWDKGNNVEIPANAAVDLVLTQPITVNPAINQTNY